MERDATNDEAAVPEKLPGNHGQFGNDNATEDYQPLQPNPPDAGRPDAGEQA